LLPVPAAARQPGRTRLPDVRQVSLELLVERFGPIWDACKKYGVTFDLECHPSERAMGDSESAGDYLTFLHKAGYDGAVGIEWEDNDAEQHAGARAALANVQRADLPPSGMRHDEMLKA